MSFAKGAKATPTYFRARSGALVAKSLRSRSEECMKNALKILLVIAAQIAYSADLAPEISALTQGTFDVQSRDARIRLAKGLLVDVKLVSDALSTPTPSDTSWAERERIEISLLQGDSAAYTNRLLQFARSPVAQHVRLYSQFQEIENALNCVADAATSLEAEFACWAEVSFYLGDSSALELAIPLLQSENKLPKNIYIDSAHMLYEQSARDIFQYLVIPFLKRQISQ